MFSSQQLNLTDYWLMVRRHKWLLILPCLAITLGTALVSLILPNIYRASTLILVEAPKVPETYVQSTASTPVQDRLRTIIQQVKSRTRLEQAITELHLVSDPHDQKVMDDYLRKMSDRIQITVQGRGHDAFAISYEAEDPFIAMRVANKLATLFIEANLKVREQQVTDTKEFLDMELQRVRALLETQEKALSNYKRQHLGELPAQQDANQRALDRLQLRLQSTVEALESARNRRSVLLRQLSLPESERLPSSTGTIAIDPLQQLLLQHRQTLADLQRVYTDQYPDVARLKQGVADLEAQLAAKRSEAPAVEPGQPATLTSGNPPGSVREEIKQIEQQEERILQQQANVREQIAAYEKKVASAERREPELMVLTRDYDSTRKNYDSLLARQQQATVAENLEKRQKSEQFQVLDPASVPVRPWKPRRYLMLVMGLAVGLAVGAGAVYLVEYLDQSFRDPEELEQRTALPVLATVPWHITAAEQHKRRLQHGLLYVTGVFIPAAAILAVHFFWIPLGSLCTSALQQLNF